MVADLVGGNSERLAIPEPLGIANSIDTLRIALVHLRSERKCDREGALFRKMKLEV